MLAFVDIYIDKNDKTISILISHINQFGFGQNLGNLIDNIRIENLKSEVDNAINISLNNYKKENPDENFCKNTKYKTWNNFFKNHELISVEYKKGDGKYYIKFLSKDLKTHSYMKTVDGYNFSLSKEVYDKKFNEIFQEIYSKI